MSSDILDLGDVETRTIQFRGQSLTGYLKGSLTESADIDFQQAQVQIALLIQRLREMGERYEALEGKPAEQAPVIDEMGELRQQVRLLRILQLRRMLMDESGEPISERDADYIVGNDTKYVTLMVALGYWSSATDEEAEAPKAPAEAEPSTHASTARPASSGSRSTRRGRTSR